MNLFDNIIINPPLPEDFHSSQRGKYIPLYVALLKLKPGERLVVPAVTGEQIKQITAALGKSNCSKYWQSELVKFNRRGWKVIRSVQKKSNSKKDLWLGIADFSSDPAIRPW